jgi:thiol-disulfide isomerase/thioredoxin
MKIMLQITSKAVLVLILCTWLAGCAADQRPQQASSASDSRHHPAPALRVKSLNSGGAEVDLSSYAGKFVLVDFWATWCAPCREEVPNLKQAYDRFGNDPRFAMLSISLDRGPSAPRNYVSAHGLTWPQGFAGSPSQSQDLTTRWSVAVIPAIFLVSPEGNIIASDLRGPELSDALSRVLTP